MKTISTIQRRPNEVLDIEYFMRKRQRTMFNDRAKDMAYGRAIRKQIKETVATVSNKQA